MGREMECKVKTERPTERLLQQSGKDGNILSYNSSNRDGKIE